MVHALQRDDGHALEQGSTLALPQPRKRPQEGGEGIVTTRRGSTGSAQEAAVHGLENSIRWIHSRERGIQDERVAASPSRLPLLLLSSLFRIVLFLPRIVAIRRRGVHLATLLVHSGGR